jgi:hypothetical protein
MKPEHKELTDKIMAGVNESMDKLILERMAINYPLIMERNGRIQKVSPFVLAEERWGKEFVERWRKEHQ